MRYILNDLYDIRLQELELGLTLAGETWPEFDYDSMTLELDL